MGITTTHTGTARRHQPRAILSGPMAWARTNLFNSWWSTAVTLALGYLILKGLMGLVAWGFLNAVWSVPVGANNIPDTTACRNAHGTGAC